MRDADRIKFSFGLTVNLGNFESLRVDAEASGPLNSGETFEEGMARLKEKVLEDVRTTAYHMKQKIQGERGSDPLSSGSTAGAIRQPWKRGGRSNP